MAQFMLLSTNLDAIIVVNSCQTNRLKDKCLETNYLLFENQEGAIKNNSIQKLVIFVYIQYGENMTYFDVIVRTGV